MNTHIIVSSTQKKGEFFVKGDAFFGRVKAILADKQPMEGFVVLTTANLTAFNGLYGHYGLLVDRKAVDAHKPCAAVVYAR